MMHDKTIIKWVRLSVIVFSIALGVVFLIAQNVIVSGIAVDYNSNMQSINDAQKNVDNLRLTPDVSVDDAQVLLAKATSAGNMISELQMGYSQIDDSTKDGLAATIKHSEKIAAFITEKEKAIPWYYIKTTQVPYVWSFAPTYRFSADKVPVLWTCRSTVDGSLLAYTTGVYDGSIDQFTDIAYHVTTVGGSYADEPTPIKTN